MGARGAPVCELTEGCGRYNQTFAHRNRRALRRIRSRHDAVQPKRHRIRRAIGVDRGRCLSRRRTRRPEKILLRVHAALPVGEAAHGPCAQLHDQRRDVPATTDERLQLPDADGLGRLWPASGERGDQQWRPAGEVDLRKHCLHEEAMHGDGLGNRLVARIRRMRPRLLPLEPVDIPQNARAGNRLPQDAGRQLGSGRPDGARERAGHRRTRMAYRRNRREARNPRLLPQDHGLR